MSGPGGGFLTHTVYCSSHSLLLELLSSGIKHLVQPYHEGTPDPA